MTSARFCNGRRSAPIAKNPNVAFDASQTFGERLADKVATFGGSWTFIIIFGVVLVLWTLGNIILAGPPSTPTPSSSSI